MNLATRNSAVPNHFPAGFEKKLTVAAPGSLFRLSKRRRNLRSVFLGVFSYYESHPIAN